MFLSEVLPYSKISPSGFLLVGDEDHFVLFDGGHGHQRSRHRVPHPEREGAAAAAPAAQEKEEVEHIAGKRDTEPLIRPLPFHGQILMGPPRKRLVHLRNPTNVTPRPSI